MKNLRRCGRYHTRTHTISIPLWAWKQGAWYVLWYTIHETIHEGDLPTPSTSEAIRQGMQKTSGGRDFTLFNMWGMVAHVPDAGSADTTIDMALATFSFSGKDPTLTRDIPFLPDLDAVEQS